MAWSAKFHQPIIWDANTLRTLDDARDYIHTLPNAKQTLPAWQAAVKALPQAAEYGGLWLDLARLGMMHALLDARPIIEMVRPKSFGSLTVTLRKSSKETRYSPLEPFTARGVPPRTALQTRSANRDGPNRKYPQPIAPKR
jgi:hypothetical protein